VVNQQWNVDGLLEIALEVQRQNHHLNNSQVPGSRKKKPAAKKEITTNVKDNPPLDATGNDGGVPVDAAGDDVDEPSDAPGNDGGEHVVDATCDDVDEPLDGR